MHTLSTWFTKNPVAANLLMVVILVSGLFTLQSIRIEGFPALPPNSVSITTVYPGASAEQVDRGVSRKIEKAMEGMPGVKKVSSYSEEGGATVWVQKISRFDMDRFHNEIKSRVDAISNLPHRAQRPIITRDEFNVEALLVQVYGDVDQYTLQKVARNVKQALVADPTITKMTPFGLLPDEIRIEVDDAALRAHGMVLEDVARAIQSASLDYRTGSI
jgi:multidrug efflux pump subunit AcrB